MNRQSLKYLIDVLERPASLADLGSERFAEVLRLANKNFLIGRIAEDAIETGTIEQMLPRIQSMLEAAVISPRHTHRKLRFEAGVIAELLNQAGIKAIALKGAAYVLTDSRAAAGRVSTDIDILVDDAQIDRAEAMFMAAGWRVDPAKDNAYDQAYYRNYMHELPPLFHSDRAMVLDLHHAILPRTSRLQPPSAELIAAAVTPEGSPIRVLAPIDRILHAATHLCHDGEFQYPLRNLLEIRDLLSEQSDTGLEWQDVVQRAADLDLSRPVLDALTLIDRFFTVAIPKSVKADLARQSRDRPWRGAVRWIMAGVIWPDVPDRANRRRKLDEWLLYIRSHWMRMPPLMLARHLWIKWRRGGQGPLSVPVAEGDEAR